MKCHTHNNIDATALCQECNKGLCAQCVNRFSLTLCDACLLARAKAASSDLYSELFAIAVIFVGTTWFLHKTNAIHLSLSSSAVLGALFAFTYCGWKFLEKIFPTTQLVGGIIWICVMPIRLIAAYFIGIVVGPIQIAKTINEIRLTTRFRHRITKAQV